MLTRRAILIGTPNSVYDPVKGAVADVRNFKRFLCLDYGGAWEDAEIRSLLDPTPSQVKAALDAALSCDYVFITFSGHGEHRVGDRLSETVLFLSKGEEFLARELNPGNDRHLVVVDACREVVRLRKGMKLGGIITEAEQAQTDRRRCREMFDAAVSAAGEGRVVMHSCSIGQTAGEDETGGVFSRLLVEDAVSECRNCEEDGVLYIPNAFESAKASTLRENSPQTPVHYPGRRLRHFPFGVVGF